MVNDSNNNQATNMSDEVVNVEDHLTPTPEHNDDPLHAQEQNSVEQNTIEKRKALLGWKVVGIAIICLLALIYTTVDHNPQPSPQELVRQAAIDNFDDRLLSCNKVMSAEPTDAFTTCLAAAEDGNPLAKRRMVWAFSRANEYQDWQAVFNWLQAIQVRDKPIELLSYAILHIMGEEPAQKKIGEQGINELVTRNYAPANILMASIYALEQNLFPPSNNTLWLLERAYEQNPNSIEPSKLALIYANGLVGKQSISKATNLLTSAAEISYPISTNNIAWFLSTLDNNPFTDRNYALDLALKVSENPEHASNYVYLDTLAAAYAANEKFDLAIATQQQAILLIDKLSVSDKVKQHAVKEFTTRLNSYEAGNPLIEYNLLTDKQTFFSQLKTSTVDFLFRNFFISVKSPLVEKEDHANNNDT